jgi:hypothetical protein
MLNTAELRKIGGARLKDAQALCRSRRYDGAIYLCGYAIEIALKARICKTLRWPSYPSTKREFENYTSFRTHDLDTLLSLSGVEGKIKGKFLAQWSAVAQWNPEARYKPIGSASKQEAELMIESVRILMREL